MIHLCNNGGGASEVEEEEVLSAMVLMLAKKKKLLVLDVKGLLVATYHKHEALPLEPHHVKFDNFYIKILLLLFFSIAVIFLVEGFVRLVYLQLEVIFCYGFLVVRCGAAIVVVRS
jgi:hypothetical protein